MLRYFMIAILALAGFAHAQTPDPVEQRVESLLSQLTIEEKIDFLGGVDGFYTKDIPRLNIPRLKMMDGPLGTRNDGPSTAYPAGIMLAATWNTQLAADMGAAIGRDARARGCHIVLGPAMNIYRVPENGRNFEYLGEDPFLAGQLAVEYTRALQKQGVAACAKHFAANNQERNRGSVNVVMDERTLHEIYLPAFKAAIQEGGAWTVMSAYNRLNGPYCTANDYLQNQVLRNQWGFKGLVMSDWGATHETLNCVTGGLDLEMPAGEHLNRDRILPLLADGRVSQSVIDDKVRRLLRMMVAMGFLDREQQPADVVSLNDDAGRAAALQVAREGLVLLKNENNLLPLDPQKVRRIAIVGPNIDPAVTGGGGSSYTQPTRARTLTEALRESFQGDLFAVAASSARAFERAHAYTAYDPAISASYFANRDLRGEPAATQELKSIDLNWQDKSPAENVPASDFSARFRGTITPKTSGPHTFHLRADDGFRLKLDGRTILEDWTNHAAYTARVNRDLEAGRKYQVEIEYYNSTGLAELRFAYAPAEALLTDADKQAIQSADAVIACVGFNMRTEGEGWDRDYAIPAEQASLIREVAQMNPNVIVVLNAGGSVDFNEWIDSAPALLHAWYPGQEGTQAIAETLFGQNNPSGRLPISIEAKYEDNPSFGHYPGRGGHVEYTEGIFVGYRHYDRANIEPRFPFGFGLSYTTFELSSPELAPTETGWRVEVDVTNTGKLAGAQVIQLYVSPNQPAVIRPEQELKAFAKVSLKPSEKKRVELTLKRDALARYDIARHAWVIDPGRYTIRLGPHSRDLPLAINLEVR